ncbi:SDR family oxidoreductase [Streptomyces luteogriseus]|uniref:SDR family NAD(P)-dependent oxidoreductase n=1 Tax=Streptomyces luteogriseus TaxID=68233 RepID=UPI002E327D4F|nr:SDR family oxidoreductase [Streptomyces luteogriseus]WTJ33369.1 SDR family oxidoreductase [Streptomyces luteogriseus]
MVTGASAGIGKATAKRFAENNDKVLLIARQEERLTQTVREIESSVPGADVQPLALDMSDAASLERLRDHVRSTGLPVSGLLCCAGAVPQSGGTEADDVTSVLTEWQEAYQANVTTAVVAVEGLLPDLADGAAIVLYSSIAAYRGSGGTGGYGAAKAALHSYVHTLATRLGSRGISANAIAPGYVADTDLFGGALPAARETMLVRQTALGRAGDPVDVAELGFYLCSEPGGYVTSQILQINGGSSHGV